MSITLNPLPTTSASNSFGDSTLGYTAGSLWPNAAARNFLRTGFVDASVTGLVYGGVGITAKTQAAGTPMLGPTLTIATTASNLTGFAVWDQSAAGVQTPQSPVSLFSPGMSISFVEFGLGQCIALPMSATNAANLLGVADNTQLTWDFTNQVLLPFNTNAIPGPSTLSAKIIDIQIGNSIIVVPNSPSSGLAQWNFAGATVVIQI
jgi:hypothetical protein